MPSVSTGSTSIPFGTNLRIGYRTFGSTGAFTYLTHYPSYDELPYTYSILTSGTYEIEYSVACPSCNSSAKFSDPQTTVVTI